MGSICRNRPKEQWNIIREEFSKQYKIQIVEVDTGDWDDYCARGYLNVYMLKSVYDKVMDGAYIWKSTAYDEIPIKVFDHDGNEIDLLEDLPK